MSSVSGKYLKDEEGNVFSPIVSSDSVFVSGKTLTEISSMEREETVVGTYEQEGLLYAMNIVLQTNGGNESGATLKIGDNIDIKYFIGKVHNPNHKSDYIIPFYENNTVFCRVELSDENLIIKTGTSEYGNGYVTGRVFYTKK